MSKLKTNLWYGGMVCTTLPDVVVAYALAAVSFSMCTTLSSEVATPSKTGTNLPLGGVLPLP